MLSSTSHVLDKLNFGCLWIIQGSEHSTIPSFFLPPPMVAYYNSYYLVIEDQRGLPLRIYEVGEAGQARCQKIK
jgi:hypothetical protein